MHQVVQAGMTGAVVAFVGLVRDFNGPHLEMSSLDGGQHHQQHASELNKRQKSDKIAAVDQPGIERESGSSPEPIEALYIEHYSGMTEQSLHRIAEQAAERWDLQGVFIHHRVGLIPMAEQIVNVIVSSSHRLGAFEAANFIMDYLKVEAPFWKKSIRAGDEQWVEARDSDLTAQNRWL